MSHSCVKFPICSAPIICLHLFSYLSAGIALKPPCIWKTVRKCSRWNSPPFKALSQRLLLSPVRYFLPAFSMLRDFPSGPRTAPLPVFTRSGPWQYGVAGRKLCSVSCRGAEESSDGFNHVGREVKGKTHTYYQVLIDSRDCPYVVSICVPSGTLVRRAFVSFG